MIKPQYRNMAGPGAPFGAEVSPATWGVCLAVVVALQLSGEIVGHFWPRAHGAGYVVTRVAVGGVLGGAIGAVLVVVAVVLAGIAGDRRLQP